MLGFNGGRLGSKNVIEQNGIVSPSSDPNYDDVGLILNGGDFIDGSKYAATVTSTGVDLDASNTNFGNASYSVLDGDVFSVPDQGQFDLSTNDFTIEGWVYRYSSQSNSSFRTIFQKRRGSGGAVNYIFFGLYLNNRFYIYITSNGSSWDIANGVNTGVALGADTWTHYAVCRQGSSIRVFIGGTLATTITSSAAISNDTTAPFQIGTDGSTNAFDGGRLAGIRATNGTARYTANFTPPTTIFDTEVLGFRASGMWTIPEVSRLRRLEAWPGSSPIVTSGLTLNVDAGNTLSYSGSGSTWTDLSGSGNNITLVNGPTFFSNNDGYINFDGVNDYGYSPAYSADSRSYTVEVWFRSSVASGKSLIAANNVATGAVSNYDRMIYMGTDGKLRFGHYDGNVEVTTDTITTNDNNWHHAVGTWDGSSLKLYRDNNLVSTNSAANASTDNGTRYWIVAGRRTVSWPSGSSLAVHYTPADIPIVRVYWGTALTASEVQQNYNAVKGRYGL